MKVVQWFRSLLFRVRDRNGNLIEEREIRDLFRRCVAIAWPSTVEGVLLSIIGSMDTMMVGTLGSAAISAVGLTGQPRMILLICIQSLCVGTMALCARRHGADDRQGANSALMQSLVLITVAGLLMSLLGFFGADWFMALAGAKSDTITMSTDYFRIICLGLVFNSWSMCICAALRAIGQTRVTMVTNITANLVNITLNYILINGKLGFPALGVRGAAIATLCSTIVSCAIAIGFIFNRNIYYHFRFPRLDRDTLTSLVKVGSGSVFESVCLRAGFLVTSRLVADLGTDAFAAYQIVSQVTGLSFTLGDGAATAGTSLVGQSLGAKRKDLAHATVAVSRRLGLILSLGLMVLILIFRRQLGLLFTKEEGILAGVAVSFFVVVLGVISQNARIIYAGCLRGAGDVRYVAVCALISVAVLRPFLTYFFSYPMDHWLPGWYFATTGPWLAFNIDAYVRHWLMARRTKKGRWLETELK